jgi:hypothetical protein
VAPTCCLTAGGAAVLSLRGHALRSRSADSYARVAKTARRRTPAKRQPRAGPPSAPRQLNSEELTVTGIGAFQFAWSYASSLGADQDAGPQPAPSIDLRDESVSPDHQQLLLAMPSPAFLDLSRQALSRGCRTPLPGQHYSPSILTNFSTLSLPFSSSGVARGVSPGAIRKS